MRRQRLSPTSASSTMSMWTLPWTCTSTIGRFFILRKGQKYRSKHQDDQEPIELLQNEGGQDDQIDVPIDDDGVSDDEGFDDEMIEDDI